MESLRKYIDIVHEQSADTRAREQIKMDNARRDQYQNEYDRQIALRDQVIKSGGQIPDAVTKRISELEQYLGINQSLPQMTPADIQDVTAGDQPAPKDEFPGIHPHGDPTVYDLQVHLNHLGAGLGKPDGLLGPRTRAAISKYRTQADAYTQGEASKMATEYDRNQENLRLGEAAFYPNPKMELPTGTTKPFNFQKPSARARKVKARIKNSDRPQLKPRQNLDGEKENFLKNYLKEQVIDLINQIKNLK